MKAQFWVVGDTPEQCIPVGDNPDKIKGVVKARTSWFACERGQERKNDKMKAKYCKDRGYSVVRSTWDKTWVFVPPTGLYEDRNGWETKLEAIEALYDRLTYYGR